MVQVPIPQEAQQGGSTGSFRAFATVPQQNATGAQISRLGQAVQSAGTATANIADVLQDDLDTARTKEAMALWNDENRVTLHDPVNGYLNKQGKAATGDARIDAQNQIARNAETFSNNLDNDDQRSMFAIAVEQQTLQLSQQMDTHEARAIQVYGIGQSKALSEESAGNAVDARTLPGEHTVERELAFQAQKKVAISEAQNVAEMLGYGPAQTEALILDTTTAIHAGVIDRFLKQGNPDMAQSYFQGVDPEEISADARTRLQGVMRTASMNDRAADQASLIIDEVDALSTEIRAAQQEGTFAAAGQDPIRLDADDLHVEALRNLRERDIPDALRQATRQRIDQHYKDLQAREATILADVVSRSQETLAEDLTMGPTQLPDEDQTELIRTGRWAAMNTFAETGRTGGNPQEHARLMGMTVAGMRNFESREALALKVLDDGMSKAERNEVLRYWDAAHAPPGTTAERGVTIAQREIELAKRHGLMNDDGTFVSDDAEAVYGAVRVEASQRLLAVESVKGLQVGEELMAVLNTAFIDQFVTLEKPRVFFGLIPGGSELRLRTSLSQSELQGTPEEVPGTIVDEETGRGGTAFAGTALVNRGRSVRVFTLPDQTEVRIPVPVNDRIVNALREAGERATNKRVAEVWAARGNPDTLEELEGR